jgi:hypothetical protein
VSRRSGSLRADCRHGSTRRAGSLQPRCVATGSRTIDRLAAYPIAALHAIETVWERPGRRWGLWSANTRPTTGEGDHC